MGAVQLHPEAVPGQPQVVRWVVPPGLTPFVGKAGEAPGELGRLLDAGVLTSVETEPAAVVTALAEGLRWRVEGGRVRDALVAALDVEGWTPKGVTRTDDETLLAIGREVAAGEAGDYVRSHGGVIDVIGARDGVLEVRMSGACSGCAAISRTLGARLSTELRRRYPALVEVREVGS